MAHQSLVTALRWKHVLQVVLVYDYLLLSGVMCIKTAMACLSESFE